jgi:hypothetical protein
MLLAFTVGFVAASAPGGVPPETAAQAFAQADVVFLGRVTRIFKDQYGYESTAGVEVVKIWKGKKLLASTVRVDGKGGPTYPARVFKLNETYLFYLPVMENGKSFRADSFLNRVLVKSEAGDDLAYLSTVR